MQPFSTMGRCGSLPPHAIFLPAMPLHSGSAALSSFARLAKRRCEITILSFSRSICRGGLAALTGVTGNLIPAVFHAIVTLSAPFGHLPLEGKAAIREYHLLKKGGEAATSPLNPEP